jgi:hypothetical protein
MKKPGRIIYVPSVLMDEVEDLQAEHHIGRRVDALESLANHARIGREMERLVNFKGLVWPVTRRKR